MTNPEIQKLLQTKRISFTLDDEEVKEVVLYVLYKHTGGSRPQNALMKQLAFDLMKKYEIPPTKRPDLEKRYADALRDARAVQPGLEERP